MHLNGSDLNVYAIIYGFSQTETQEYTGSAQYLADFCGISKRSVLNILAKLTDSGCLLKREENINGVRLCRYRVANFTGSEEISPVVKKLHGGGEESSLGVVKKLHRGGEKTSPNIIDYKIDNTIENNYLFMSTGELDSEKNSGSSMSEANVAVRPKTSAGDVFRLYNEICKSLPPVTKMTADREKHINARLKEFSIDDFRQVFQSAEDSAFCKGQNNRGWKATFDFLISERGFVNTLEGKYSQNHNVNAATATSDTPHRIGYRYYEDASGCFHTSYKKSGNKFTVNKEYDDGRTVLEEYDSQPEWIS